MKWMEPITIAQSCVVTAWISGVMLATAVAQVSSPVGDADLYDVHFVDAETGWTVGDRGALWHTRDGGAQWQLQRCPSSHRLSGVCFVDARHGWIVDGAVRPYLLDGEGRIFATDDGGQSWAALKRAHLSYVHDVKFVSDRFGFVLTAPQPLLPGGLFQTRDAGRSWHPLACQPRDDWIELDAAADGRLLLVGRYEAQAEVIPDQPDSGIRTARIASPLRDGCYLRPGRAIVVGDRGRVLALLDGRWRDASQAVPNPLHDPIDFRTVTAAGRSVWVAGAPGTVVLRSDDGGATWRTCPTGQSLPIHKLAFVDEQHGWAVGALGLIMATNDGGVTWKIQRGQERRLGVLVLCDRPTSLPLELLAHLSAEHNLRSRAIVLDANGRDPSWSLHPADRLQAAAAAVGASGADAWHEFPLAPEIVAANQDTIAAGWIQGRQDRGRRPLGRTGLRRKIATAIRQWRPSIVVVGMNENHAAMSRLLLSETQAVMNSVGDEDPHLASLRLPAWQPSHLIAAAVGSADPGEHLFSVMPSRLALNDGTSIGELAAQAGTLLTHPPRQAALVTCRSVASPPLRGQWMQRVRSQAVGAERDRDPSVAVGTSNVEALARQVQRQENVRALLRRASTGGEVGRAAQLIRSLPDQAASRMLLLLAERQAATNDYQSQLHTWKSIRQQLAQEPAAKEALWRQFASQSSEEVRVRFQNSGARAIPTTTPHPVISQVAAPQPTSSASQVVPAVRVSGTAADESARELFGLADAELRVAPEWQLAMAAVDRAHGHANSSLGLLRRQKRNGPSQAWRLAAATEIWLTEPSRDAPKPTWSCRVGTRPHLDGRLDEPIWQAATPQQLGPLLPLAHPLPTEVFIARDDEFLYLAARCFKIGGMAYPAAERARPRDTPPGDLDRVDFFFDVNRDYHSGWQLGFDCRGHALDYETGNIHWNPTWYVAADQDGSYWTIEAAVPLRELTLNPLALDAWVCGVRRVIPGWGWQAWPQDAGAQPAWHQMGYLLFEVKQER